MRNVIKSGFSFGLLLLFFSLGCRKAEPAAPALEGKGRGVDYTYKVINSFPHDEEAFTQGLVYADGLFYEGTGLRGQSTLRRVQPLTGKVLQKIAIPDHCFGEGITVLRERIYQITWRENTGFVYDKNDFKLLKAFAYSGEGWGITHDGARLIMSDGSSELRFLDPETLQEIGHITVTDDGEPVTWLNELEYIDGEIYANIFQDDVIVKINPESGAVTGRIDMEGLHRVSPDEKFHKVLNGIAFDRKTNRLFVTGKCWPKVFEIELVKKQ